jgi:hypothetical protein
LKAIENTADSIIFLGGRIEGHNSPVAPETSGRILKVRPREDDGVKAEGTVTILDDEQVWAGEGHGGAALLGSGNEAEIGPRLCCHYTIMRT